MKKFRVEVKEIYRCYVDVEAEDEDAAYEIVEKRVDDCDVIASRDYDHFDRDITVGRHPDDVARRVAESGTVF